MPEMEIAKKAAEFRQDYQNLRDEVGRVIVGHSEIVDGVLSCLFTGGHVLLEGVPGLGKTMLVKALSEALNVEFSRIQFTPDLMPADILGTNLVVESEDGAREFRFQKGPIFANIVLADEINRATPKTQSALLEAMQEQTVTVANDRYDLASPFFVMATQNPLEMEGTYPLPEAQLDRFLFKLMVHYSSREEMGEILTRTTEGVDIRPKNVMNSERVNKWRQLVHQVIVAPHVKDYAVRLVLSTHPGGQFATELVNRYVRFGASPRGAQALVFGGKVRALLDGRYNVSFEDIRQVVHASFRHRLILNFEGEAEGIDPDQVIDEIAKVVPRKAAAAAGAQG